ncbi:MAG: SRPBCC family protein [Gammaproteobacteria bacterium]
MKKIAVIISALFFVCATAANAHGPVRQKFKDVVEINAPADKVWNIIKNFDDLSWLPAVASTEGEGGNKKGAKRTLTLKKGGTIVEELKKYNEDRMTYAYKIKEMSDAGTIQHSGKEEKIPVLPVNNYSATITVKGKGDKTQVIWQAAYYRAYMNNNPPAELNEDAANNAVSLVLKAGLKNLKELAEAK